MSFAERIAAEVPGLWQASRFAGERSLIAHALRAEGVLARELDEATICSEDVLLDDGESCDDGDPDTNFEFCDVGLCGNGIVPIDLRKLFVWPIIGEASLVKATGRFASSFVFDLSQGIDVTLREPASQSPTFTFDQTDCQVLPGNRITCIEVALRGNTTDRIRIRPDRSANTYKVDVFMNSMALDFPVIGTVLFELQIGGRPYGSQLASCRGGTPPAMRVTCTP